MVGMHLHQLSIGQTSEYPYQHNTVPSAIGKQPTDRPLQLTSTGLIGDQQADLKHHGGPDKAICVYPLEHYPHWNSRLERELAFPAFGENFTTAGLLESEVCLGDVYQVGEVQVQVSQPRVPCFKLAMRHGIKQMPVWVTESGFTGFYFRVLQTGTVQAGDPIRLLERGQITVQEANRVMHHDREDQQGIVRLLQDSALAQVWKNELEKRLGRG